MQKWQKTTRWVMAVVAIVFVVAVAFTLKKRVTPQTHAPLARTDEKAVLETSGGRGNRTNKTRSDFKITWDKMLTYEDGSSKFIGLKVITERNEKTFEITGKEGKVRDAEGTVEVHGNVHVKVSDGLEVDERRSHLHEVRRYRACAGCRQLLARTHERFRRRLRLRQQSGHSHDSRPCGGPCDRRRQRERRDGCRDWRIGIPPARIRF